MLAGAVVGEGGGGGMIVIVIVRMRGMRDGVVGGGVGGMIIRCWGVSGSPTRLLGGCWCGLSRY